MHAKCVHKDNNLEPENEEAKANFVCNVRGCGKLFVEEKQLDTHFKHHENFTPRSGKHKCHLCKETFLQKIMLKKHILRTHKEATSVNKKKKSELRSLKKKNGYIRSMEDPVDLKYDPGITLIPGTMMDALKCPVCGKSSFTDSKAFKLHCMHIHKDKSLKPIAIQQEAKYICQVENCGKLFIEQKQFRIHQQHHKTYVPSAGRFFNCTQCEAKFTTQDNLEVHSIQFHSGGDDVTSCQNNLIFDDITLAPGTIMTVYHCPVDNCPKRNYLDAKSVKTHCRRHHNMSSATLFEIVPMKREAQFICQVRGCRKLFAEAYQIEAHLKHHRTYIPTNGHFDCKLCDESFKRKELLDQHTKDYHTSNSQNEINEIQNTGKISIEIMKTIFTVLYFFQISSIQFMDQC